VSQPPGGSSEQMTTSKQESVDHNININIRINEEYARLVPVISGSEYETIKQSLKQDGQHIPVIINQKGEILDGHTRFKACKEIGIAPRTMMREEFDDLLLEKQFILDINRKYRHLSPFQRIELECKYETIESELVPVTGVCV
jgi:ParB-like chromosome segregation protein Spo0J